MPTINQLIKKSRVKPITRNKVPALEQQPLKTWCLSKSLYNNSKKTKLSFKKSCKSKIIEWF